MDQTDEMPMIVEICKLSEAELINNPNNSTMCIHFKAIFEGGEETYVSIPFKSISAMLLFFTEMNINHLQALNGKIVKTKVKDDIIQSIKDIKFNDSDKTTWYHIIPAR